MIAKKTAIQIAIENVDQCLNLEDVKGMLCILLEMEKQQIISAWNSAYGGDSNYTAEQYYNETFKSK